MNKFRNLDTEAEDCLNCIFYPLFFSGKLIGIHHINSKCTHGNKYFVKYERSNISLFIGSILLFTFVTVGIYNIIDVYSNARDFSQLQFIMKIGLITFDINMTIMLSMQIINADLVLKELQIISNIIHEKHSYGIKVFINEKDGLIIRIYVWCATLLAYSLFIVVFIAEMLFLDDYELLTICNAITTPFYISIEAVYFAILLVRARTYAFLLSSVQKHIENVLNTRLARLLDNAPKEKIDRMDFPINNMLQKLQIIYYRLIKNIERFNNNLSALLLSNILEHIILFILSYYILYLIWLTDEPFNLSVVKCIETNLVVIGTIIILFECENLYVSVERFNHFFYKFPMHRLNIKEMNQFMILKICMEKLEIRANAFGLVYAQAELLSTIMATVLSYVLLAIQFHATWNEHIAN